MFDFTSSEFEKFKTSWNKILERQDQSLLSILTRVTSLEIRVDALEDDGIGPKTIDTGLGKSRGRAEKQQLLESLQISEKLVEDFKMMRKEVFNKLYEFQEKDLKMKANWGDLQEMETKFNEKFHTYDKETKKYKEDFKESIKNLQNRIKMQSRTTRARSPNGDIDSSAMMSKIHNKEFKCVNCDKNLGQLDKLQPDYSRWKNMPNISQMPKKSKMLHLGKGYSKLLQSYNNELFSPDSSFKNDYNSDNDVGPFHNSILKTLDNRELDPSGLDLECKRLPQIRSTRNIKNFETN